MEGTQREHADDVWSASMGPTPVEEALRIADGYRRRTAQDPVMQAAIIVNAQAGLLAMAGRMDEAREACAWGRSTFRELALPLWLYASGTIGPSAAELRAGDPSRAEEMLVEGIEGLERIDAQGVWLVNDLELLVAALVQLGRLADAETAIARLEELTGSPLDFRENVLLSLRGQVAMLRGDTAAAVDLFTWSLERTGTGWLPFRGDLHRFLAEALREDGRGEEAQVVARQALEIYRTKGDIVSAGRVEVFLETGPRLTTRRAFVQALARPSSPLSARDVLWAIGETTRLRGRIEDISVRMGLPERHRCASRRDIVGTNGWAIPLVEQARCRVTLRVTTHSTDAY